MKAVILDGYTINPGDLSWQKLAEMVELEAHDYTPPTDRSETIKRIGDAEILLTSKSIIDEEVFANCPNLKFLSVLATGYNVVDIEAARKHNVTVSNVPAYSTDTVAQHTIALLLEICNNVGHHAKTVMDGRWSKSRDFCYWDFRVMELAGKTMGIVGFGNIGQKVADIAAALGMKVMVYNSHRVGEKNKFGEYASLDKFLSESDIISLHCPMTSETKEFVREENIAKMKDGVIILNTSRGQLIKDEDLKEALESGKVGAAGLDVVSVEPMKEDNPLLKAKNIFITPHIAWASKEARQRLIDVTVGNIKAFIDKKPINVVS